MERMTPDCYSQAWAKATGKELTDLSSTETSNIWAHGDIATGWKLVPDAESAEWLAEITEAATAIETNELVGSNKAVRVFFGKWLGGSGPDLRPALCAALNGSPCERKAV